MQFPSSSSSPLIIINNNATFFLSLSLFFFFFNEITLRFLRCPSLRYRMILKQPIRFFFKKKKITSLVDIAKRSNDNALCLESISLLVPEKQACKEERKTQTAMNS